MLQRIRKSLKNKKGFTLVELIVVIAVLGILASLAVPKFVGIQDDAKEKVDAQNLKMIQNVVEIYRAENGELPDTDTKMGKMVETYLNDEVPSPQEKEGYVFVMDNESGKISIKASAGNDETEVKKD